MPRRRYARRASNPGSGSTIVTVGIIGAVGYFLYKYMLAPQASADVVLAAASPAATGTPTSSPASTPVMTPPLGSTVSGAAQVALQAAANYPYIIPDATTFAAYAVTPLPGYSAFSLTDNPNILLRSDVAQAANAAVSQTGVPISLAQLQSLMSTQGLHGLGLAGLYPMYGGAWN